MPVRTEIREGLVPVKIYTGEIEPAARQQLVNISRLPSPDTSAHAMNMPVFVPAASGERSFGYSSPVLCQEMSSYFT